MEIPVQLNCLLRNLYAGQEATVRTGQEITDWFKIGKGVRQGCTLSLCLFYLYADGLDESQAIIKIARRNIQQPQIFRLYHSNGRKRRATKEPLDESERGELKSGFKLNIKKTKIMASGFGFKLNIQ